MWRKRSLSCATAVTSKIGGLFREHSRSQQFRLASAQLVCGACHPAALLKCGVAAGTDRDKHYATMTVRLFVLGLLSRSPMHGYQIRKALDESRASVWAEVLSGSIYHALAALQREGMVALRDVENIGERTRTVYKITPAGRVQLKKLAAEAWGTPPDPYPTRLYSALAFIDVLTPEIRRTKVALARVRLDEEIADWEEALRSQEGLSATMRLAFENARAHLMLDRKLLVEVASLDGGATSPAKAARGLSRSKSAPAPAKRAKPRA